MIGLEICVDTVKGLTAAVQGGADRIELCAALALGGLSPSAGLLEAARSCPVPVHVMLRPRAGDFLFSEAEISGMLREIALIREAGFAGVVLGAGSEGGPDLVALARLSAAADGLSRTLHRVVDLFEDRVGLLQSIRDLGFERVLTSGGRATAVEGIAEIRRMVEAAPAGLTVMPGSGVTPETVAGIVRGTGAREVHASAAQTEPASSRRLVDLGFAQETARVVTADNVRRLKQVCMSL